MVNTQFADILAKGDTMNYMDDFLVASKDKATYRERVNQLLKWLQKLDLYLKLDKCIFKTNRVEFLGVICYDLTNFLIYVLLYPCHSFMTHFLTDTSPFYFN